MNVCIIPARGGSKRIPRKNIKNFCGKPMIAYSIETAKKSGVFEEIFVSTDDAEIAKIAKQYGASVPYLRPDELSDDFAPAGVAVEHMLDYLKQKTYDIQFACTLYATAPLLEPQYLIQGLQKLQNSDAKYTFSATSMPYPIWRSFRLTENERCEMFWPQHYHKRSQDLEEAYHDAGQFYWKKMQNKTQDIMFSKHSIPIILPRHLVQDIDTIEDWQRVELMYKVLYGNIK